MNGEKNQRRSATNEVTPEALSRLHNYLERQGLHHTAETVLDIFASYFATPPESIAPTPVVTEVKQRGGLKKLVDAGAPWSQVIDEAWQVFAASPSAEEAVKLLEFCSLRAAAEQILTLVQKIMGAGITNFYPQVHEKIRRHIAREAFTHPQGNIIFLLLSRNRDFEHYLPVEKLFVFLKLAMGTDSASAFFFWRRADDQIRLAFQEEALPLGYSLDAYLLLAGKTAMAAGHVEEAQLLFGEMTPGSVLHEEALQISLRHLPNPLETQRSDLAQKLSAEASDEARIQMLGIALQKSRSLGGFKDPERVVLSEVLRTPLEYFAKNAESFALLSQLIVQNRDLDILLPHILEVFELHAKYFFTPEMDMALWHGFASIVPHSAKDHYWQGVAFLHRYIASSGQKEEVLWNARRLVLNALSSLEGKRPLSWQELLRAATAHVEKSPLFLLKDQQRLLRSMQVAGETQDIRIQDALDYLGQSASPPLVLLEDLKEIGRRRGAANLFLAASQRLGQAAHFRNQDLADFYRYGITQADHDLVWRVCTILKTRGYLVDTLEQQWGISGEKRSAYPFLSLSKEEMEIAYHDMDVASMRFCRAITILGDKLPDLLALLDRGSRQSKAPSYPKGSMEQRVDIALHAQEWLAKGGKRVFLSTVPVAENELPVPFFAHSLLQNHWSIVVSLLSSRLGLSVWDWNPKVLLDTIGDLFGRLSVKGSLKFFSNRVASWLHRLSTDERVAWQELGQILRHSDERKLQHDLARLVCRIAVLIHPNHFQALTSLQAMRAPVALLWDVENFIMSSPYTVYRHQRKIATKVLVPANLHSLRTPLRE